MEFVCISCCTVKNLQHVKLSLRVETFHGDGDVVSLLHCDTPGTHLEIGVAFRPAGAQDHSRRVVSHVVSRTLDCGKTENKTNLIILAHGCQQQSFEMCHCSATHTHTDTPWQVGGGASICSLSPRRHVRISLPTRENPGWHLYLMMSPAGDTDVENKSTSLVV